MMPLQALLISTTTQIAVQRVGSSWAWYMIRGAGFAAAGLLVLLMISGIGQVTGLTYRFLEPVRAWMVHKALALALCAAIFIHVLFLLFDHFVLFSIVQVLVPFASNYSNGTRLLGLPLGGMAVSFGIAAMYLVAAIVATSLGWIDSKKTIWRWVHYSSYLVMLLIFLHALYVGSDLKYGIFRTTWILMGVLVLAMIISRLARAGSLRRK